jgi:hypothetical protein
MCLQEKISKKEEKEITNPHPKCPLPPGTCTLIGKKIKFPHTWGLGTFRVEQRIYEEMRKYFPINEETVNHI